MIWNIYFWGAVIYGFWALILAASNEQLPWDSNPVAALFGTLIGLVICATLWPVMLTVGIVRANKKGG